MAEEPWENSYVITLTAALNNAAIPQFRIKWHYILTEIEDTI